MAALLSLPIPLAAQIEIYGGIGSLSVGTDDGTIGNTLGVGVGVVVPVFGK